MAHAGPVPDRKGRINWAARLAPVLKGWVKREEFHYSSFYARYSHDIGNVLNLQMSGFYARDGVVHLRWHRLVILLEVTFAPVFLSYILLGSYSPEEFGNYIGWVYYFTILGLLAQAAALGGVKLFHGLTTDLELCLTPKGMNNYEQWARVATAPLSQRAFAVLMVSAAWLMLRSLSITPGFENVVPINPISYLTVGICVTYVSGGVWWAFAGSILAVRLSSSGCMRLLPYAPAQTPGLESLLRLYRIVFTIASVGAAACLTPIYTWTRQAAVQADQIRPWLYLLSGLASAALLFLAVLPDVALTRAISETRRALIHQLTARLPLSPTAVDAPTAGQNYMQTWLQTLTSSAPATISESVIVTFLTTAISTTAPFVVSYILAK